VSAVETQTEIPELHFAAGLPGFPDHRRFTLVWWGDEDGPFSILVSLDEPTVEFLVVPPAMFFPDYEPEIDDDVAERLGLETAEDALLLVIVTVGDDPAAATANLLGPIIVNRHTRDAIQAVLVEGDHPLRAPLLPS
jgi:flagellar assembly factor FliW